MYSDEIQALRESIAESENKVAAQRERLACLTGHEPGAWMAAELLAGSEAILQDLRDRLNKLMDKQERLHLAEAAD